MAVKSLSIRMILIRDAIEKYEEKHGKIEL